MIAPEEDRLLKWIMLTSFFVLMIGSVASIGMSFLVFLEFLY